MINVKKGDQYYLDFFTRDTLAEYFPDGPWTFVSTYPNQITETVTFTNLDDIGSWLGARYGKAIISFTIHKTTTFIMDKNFIDDLDDVSW